MPGPNRFRRAGGRVERWIWRGWGLLVGAVWFAVAAVADGSAASDHWAFRPLAAVRVPTPRDLTWACTPVDSFILTRLESVGLSPAPPTDRRTWMRRVSLDLIGLPPTPEQQEAFLRDEGSDAEARWVEFLLASPRYGERWAQYWLDLVRYADTHGFEVNTERPHAWPYRDYVIRALNEDRPFDRFVTEQLVGDSLGEDAATGFLVTAAALLPGQIGQDDASKRLARQDELTEIVHNVGEAFLGLSIGCARCHDHKFDPISQRDFFATQAFFAGVEYGDRPIRTPEAEARRQEAESLKPQLAEVESALTQFEPLARLNSEPRRESDPRRNEITFAAQSARVIRFTIHEANRHPNLGVIEPCLDEFEVFSAGPSATNLALASAGAKVSVSGSKVSDKHRPEHLTDGRYGNDHSWMSDEAGRGWVQIELPEARSIDRVVWGRDREGQFNDRLTTAYSLEVGLPGGALTTVAFVPPLRSAVSARRNTDRFVPVTTRRLRMTIMACTTLEPCLDELEVFTVGSNPTNVARLPGVRVTASGTFPESTEHRLEHLNDGQYGNDRSWISHEVGRGWVELEFPEPTLVDRVIWGRDRTGQFADRLPTTYRIEVQDEAGRWREVAGSTDRRAYEAEDKSPPPPALVGLESAERSEAERLLNHRRDLQRRLKELAQGPQVFGGIFKAPEVIRVLRRGDPEQPGDTVVPSRLTVLGAEPLTAEASDPERRRALAQWIVQSPLSARVWVNRVWQGHFGLGLVETANDFGLKGAAPSHPELLEWLAGEFQRAGGSLKHLHRLLVLSATYRQSSRIDPQAVAVDASDRLLWRFPSRRLEAETIRDSILAVNGRLDLKMGGPGFNLFRSRGGLDGFPPLETFTGDGLRRLIYSHKVRMERDAVFAAFDCPDAGQITGRRRQSTTPLQALNLFNSRFTLEESEVFAARVRADVGDAPEAQVRRAYQLALGREPEAVEARAILPVVKEQGLAPLCRALYNSSEFLVLP